jgi:hypothetical protein
VFRSQASIESLVHATPLSFPADGNISRRVRINVIRGRYCERATLRFLSTFHILNPVRYFVTVKYSSCVHTRTLARVSDNGHTLLQPSAFITSRDISLFRSRNRCTRALVSRINVTATADICISGLGINTPVYTWLCTPAGQVYCRDKYIVTRETEKGRRENRLPAKAASISFGD